MSDNKPNKGLKNGSCNVTACQMPGAEFYNKSTQKYYCKHCAHDINVANRRDCIRLYGTPLLCEKDKDDK